MTQRILIVEDDTRVSDLLTTILTLAGYEVQTMDSAFGAAGPVHDFQPCVVLLDIGLPFRPGTDLLAELKRDERTAQVPVVVLSALTESLTEERRALAAAVVAKPFGIQHLLEVLRQACSESV